jgi:hypothetical protein
MQNATREMLCKTFSSAADRADEEQLSEKPVPRTAGRESLQILFGDDKLRQKLMKSALEFNRTLPRK